MAHDAHFLRRLERLDHGQLDLALGLYRDPRAVRLILAAVDVSHPSDRVALALGDGPDAPHVIVARDGGFVTCLGPGMAVGDHPKVSRAQIDSAFDKSAQLDRFDARVAMRGGVTALLARVFDAGHRLAREDFEAAALLAPLIQQVIIEAIRGAVLLVSDVQRSMTQRRLRRADRDTERLLRHYATHVDLIRHLTLLAITGERFALTDGESLEGIATVGGLAAMTGDLGGIIASASFAAMMGPDALAGYAGFWAVSTDAQDFMLPLVGLLGIGVRHPQARGEVERILGDRVAPVFEGAAGPMAKVFAEGAIELLQDDKVGAAVHRVQDAVRASLASTAGTDPSTVPDMLVDGVIANTHFTWLGSPEGTLRVPVVAVWAATREPVDFYLPASWLSRMDTRLDLDAVRRGLIDFVRFEGRSVPRVRASAKVGRNAPCPCGSGRKHKRCCLGST